MNIYKSGLHPKGCWMQCVWTNNRWERAHPFHRPSRSCCISPSINKRKYAKIQKWLNSSWRIRSPPPPHILHPLHPQWAICITGKIPTCTILSPSSRPTCVHPAIQACDPLTNDVWVESYLDKLLKIMLVAVFPRWPLLEKHLFLKLMYMNIGENL
jgi:hypothetical protein